MNFDFIKDARWFRLDQKTQEEMLNAAFERDIASNPKWNQLPEDERSALRSAYNERAKAFEEDNAPERTFAGTMGDIGLSVAQGVVDAGTNAVGILDIPTGGAVGNALSKTGWDPNTTQQFLEDQKSDAGRYAAKKVADAKGFTGTAQALLQNPSTIVNEGVKMVPQMIGGGQAVAKALGKVGVAASPMVGGAIWEGLQSAGNNAEQIRQETGGLTAKQSALMAASGGLTTLVSLIGGRVAQKLGVGDIDTLFAGGQSGSASKNIARRMIEGGLTESVLEEMPQSAQEQVFLNAALGKPLTEGVGEATAQGGVVAGFMGAGANIPANKPSPADIGKAKTVDEAVDTFTKSIEPDQQTEPSRGLFEGQNEQFANYEAEIKAQRERVKPKVEPTPIDPLQQQAQEARQRNQDVIDGMDAPGVPFNAGQKEVDKGVEEFRRQKQIEKEIAYLRSRLNQPRNTVDRKRQTAERADALINEFENRRGGSGPVNPPIIESAKVDPYAINPRKTEFERLAERLGGKEKPLGPERKITVESGFKARQGNKVKNDPEAMLKESSDFGQFVDEYDEFDKPAREIQAQRDQAQKKRDAMQAEIERVKADMARRSAERNTPESVRRIENQKAMPELEAWRKPLSETSGPMAKEYHRASVKKAIEDGKFVPAEVLKDYPDLVSSEDVAISPKDISEKETLKRMRSEANNSQTNGANYIDGVLTYHAASSPRWMKILNEETKKSGGAGWSRNEINTLISKKLRNMPFTEKQAARFELLKKASIDAEFDAGDVKASDEAATMEQNGFVPMGGQEKAAVEFNNGDKFIGEVDGVKDEWTVKGDDENGNVIIKDGIEKRVDPFSPVKVDGIKPVGGGDDKKKGGANQGVKTATIGEVTPTTQFQTTSDAKNPLYVVHNLSEKNLAHADKIGGLAAPSIGISSPETGGLSGFGEISLVADPSMIDPRASKTNKVFNADAYSPRYPSVKYVIDGKTMRRVWSELSQSSKDLGNIISSELDDGEVGRRGIEAFYDSTVVQYEYLKTIGKAPENNGRDGWGMRSEIREIVAESGNKDFRRWVDDNFSDVIKEEKIYAGQTPSGTNKYLPHNLSNVVKVLTKKIRDGEGFNYGAGSVRAVTAKQFKSISDIKKDRGKIVPEETMEAFKEEADKELLRVAYELKPYYKYDANKFGYYDDASEAMKEYVNKGRSGFSEFYRTVPDNIMNEVNAFLDKLRNAPTEYFEAKLQRPVFLNEFKYAVIPNDASSKTREILQRKGLEIKEYDPNIKGDRARVIAELNDILFQTGRPGIPLTADQLKSRFPNQTVGTNKDGSIFIRMKNGMGLTIQSVKEMDAGDYELAARTGRLSEGGMILGKYVDRTITLNQDYASTLTMDHEIEHFLEDVGLISDIDKAVLDSKISALEKQGKNNFKLQEDKRENRANFLAQYLSEREQYRGTPIGRVLQKIADFLDGLWNIGRSSVRKIAMGVETGKIYEKTGKESSGDVQNMRNTDTPEFKKWFGDSKVVDENEEPLVVYHGTAVDINEFDPNKIGTVQYSDWGKGFYFTPSTWQADGYSEDARKAIDAEGNKLWDEYEAKAKEYKTSPMNASIDLGYDNPKYKDLKTYYDRWVNRRSEITKQPNKIVSAYLSIQNPYNYTATNMTDHFLAERAISRGHDGIIIRRGDGSIDEIVAFKPTQIKSIYNAGTFDPTNPDIRFSTSSDVFAKSRNPITQEDYESVLAYKSSIKLKVLTETRRVLSDIKEGTDKVLGAISTRLGNISPTLKAKVRNLDGEINLKLNKRLHEITPMLEKAKKTMSRKDFKIWDYARKNSDIDMINKLVDQYDLKEEYARYRSVLEEIKQEAIATGLDIGNIEEYAPRVLKDARGFLNYLEKGDKWDVINRTLRDRAEKMGIGVETLNPEMRASIISNIIYGGPNGMGGPAATKKRVFDKIPPELDRFYMSSDAALYQHVATMTQNIEKRKFFGRIPTKVASVRRALYMAEEKIRELNGNMNGELSKKQKDIISKSKSLLSGATPREKARIEKKIAKLESIKTMDPKMVDGFRRKRNHFIKTQKEVTAYLEKLAAGDFTEHIGQLVDDLIKSKELKDKDQATAVEILSARFHDKGTHGLVGMYKNLAYIDTMGSLTSALTQIGDSAWVMYEAGLIGGLKHYLTAARGKSRITKQDIGIERIAQEFADFSTLGNAVSKVFRIVGLEKMDTIGKEALINASFEKLKKEAKSSPLKLKVKINPIFGAETQSVIDDLNNDIVSDNVKMLLFHRLLDFQPVALSEMPQKYLTAGNGRVFYMLKTFTIKQFDVYRNEIFKDLASGDRDQKIQAMKNLVRLSMFFVAANAGSDLLKDILLRRETTMDDRVVENLLRLAGLSRYTTWQARREGAWSAIERTIFPPFKFLDSATKDIINYDDGKGLYSVSSIPVIGKNYYWWLGRGANNKVETEEIRFRNEKKKYAKYKTAFDESSDKASYRLAHRQELARYNKLHSVEGELNQLKSKINRLKKAGGNESIIKRLSERRIQIINNVMR